MRKALIIRLQGLSDTAQKERCCQKRPELAQVSCRLPRHKKRTDSRPQDDRRLQEIGKQETRRGPGHLFYNE